VTVSRIHHAGITVSNLERSLRFYRDLLGLRVLADSRMTDARVAALLGTEVIDLRIVDLDTNDGRIIELLEYVQPSGERVDYTSRDPGSGHIALAVDDLERVRAGIEQAGGSVISREPVTAVDTEGMFAHARLLYIRDPDGMILELVQRP
jgi:catechol 2,3-dioxygenase-like lactoylglutathione lyase family enzyme